MKKILLFEEGKPIFKLLLMMILKIVRENKKLSKV